MQRLAYWTQIATPEVENGKLCGTGSDRQSHPLIRDFGRKPSAMPAAATAGVCVGLGGAHAPSENQPRSETHPGPPVALTEVT